MKFTLAYAAAAAAVHLSHTTPKMSEHQRVMAKLSVKEDLPFELSENGDCATAQLIIWASLYLLDTDDTLGVSAAEIDGGVAELLSVTEEEVEWAYNALAGMDGDASSVSEEDGEAACVYLLENGYFN